MKIQRKLLLVFAIPLVMLIILAVFFIGTIDRVETNYTTLLAGPQQRLVYATETVRELTNIRRYILSMGYMMNNDGTVEEYYERCQKSSVMFLQYTDRYYENLINDPFLSNSEKKWREATVSDVRKIFKNEYQQYITLVYEAVLAKDTQRINSLILKGIILGDDLTGKLDYLRFSAQETVNIVNEETMLFTDKSQAFTVIISIFTIFLTIVLSVFLANAIKNPIVKIGNAVSEIAKGDLTYPVRNAYKDEIGILSNDIGDMVEMISSLNKTLTIVDNLDDSILVTDLNYNVVYWNRKMGEVFRANGSEPRLQMKCYEINGEADMCSFCPIPHLLPEKENFPSHKWERSVTKAGKETWLACTTSIARWVDGSYVQISVYRDDTVRRQQKEQQIRHEKELREAAEETSRMKSIFLANMSHEIRTPMNSIIGFVELALDGDIQAKTRDYLSKIKMSAENLLQIINDILDISKIEAGKMELENIPFDIDDVFKQCRIITSPRAMEKGLTLFCYAEPAINKMLIGDPTRLRQALLNLLTNAIKFTNAGIVKLLSSIVETREDGYTIRFEVKDSGIGMTEEQTQKIFQPFVQADYSTTRKFGGTGLGLSITKNIVELMGGELKVESMLGLGSKFSFELTFKTINKPKTTDVEDMPQAYKKPLFNGKVLVCEDNALNQQVIEEHLARVGLEAVIAANGAEGVDHVKHHMEENNPFDLILMDTHMPIMDGLEAAKKLAEMGNKTPVVALTANVMATDRKLYQSIGMLDCVSKPFLSQDLWACLLKYLKPVALIDVNPDEQDNEDKHLSRLLVYKFVKDNQTTFKDINDAIKAGDIKRAHRLAHTLNGVAGTVGMTMLQQAAQVIEHTLAGGGANFTDKQINKLEFELNAALRELAPLSDKYKNAVTAAENFNKEDSRAMFDKLDKLLESDSFDCLTLVKKLERIPGTQILIDQIESFNFKQARETLVGIREKAGG